MRRSIFPAICSIRQSNLFLNEFLSKWATTILFKLRGQMALRFSIPFIFIGSTLYSSIIWTQLLSLRLCIIECHRRILEISSTKLLNKIFVPFIFKCSFEPFKCLVLIELLWSIYNVGSSPCIDPLVCHWLRTPFSYIDRFSLQYLILIRHKS